MSFTSDQISDVITDSVSILLSRSIEDRESRLWNTPFGNEVRELELKSMNVKAANP